MTLDEIRAMDKPTLTPAEVARFLHCDAQGLRMTAREAPDSLGFPVSVIGSRVKIPREAFICFMTGKENT